MKEEDLIIKNTLKRTHKKQTIWYNESEAIILITVQILTI